MDCILQIQSIKQMPCRRTCMKKYQTSGFEFDKSRPTLQKCESWLNLEKKNATCKKGTIAL